MLLTRFEPFKELRELRRGFDYLSNVMEELEEQGYESGISSFTPTVNSREADDAYFVEIDLPGVKKEDIEINLEDNILRISGERKVQNRTKDNEYYKIESKYGKFVRNFTLPKDINANKIDANFKNGVLEVKILKQKTIKSNPKKIEIK
ncbi:MAG: Hsp20/alpha crystallin family protein [Epsilonproteobacteria bacterium]|nr:Hsp20/alpha crystallin family protein [Campylobacterota bacterium]